MTLEEFAAYHGPALEADEARHNVMLSILGRAAGAAAPARFWTMGAAGACAIEMPGRPILLGALDAAGCARLADEARHGFSRRHRRGRDRALVRRARRVARNRVR